MGSAAGHQLAARGARVLGLEQFGPAHDQGSSHGESRIIRQAYYEHPSYVPLVRRAYELWETTEAESGRYLINLTGGLMIGRANSGIVSGSRLSAQTWHLPYEMLDAAGVHERFPTFTLADDEVALYEAAAGFVIPEEALTAQIDLATRHGAELRFGERVTDWAIDGDGVRLWTASDCYRADRLVICAGAWAARLLHLEVPLSVERQVMHWFVPDGGVAPFAASHHPVYGWEDATGDFIYGFPAREGDHTVKVAFFRRPVPCDPDRVDRTVHPDEIAEIAAYVGTRLPSLRQHHRAVTCLYTLTPDRHFLLGVHPQHAQVVVAAGFSGHGFKFTPVIGEILAHLALNGTTTHDISLFDPARG
ncbi:MAG: N-methyl-L-tryptophan oxidase [Actinomycetota bacterium]|nr:N-methyl-L-tryptophan oxidase [Actinomycetota bacterium]